MKQEINFFWNRLHSRSHAEFKLDAPTNECYTYPHLVRKYANSNYYSNSTKHIRKTQIPIIKESSH